MEQTTDAVVVPLDAGWSDVGSWSALWDVPSEGRGGQCHRRRCRDAGDQGLLVRADSRLVVAVGVKDLVIVETEDVVLVAQWTGFRTSRRSWPDPRSRCEPSIIVWSTDHGGTYDSIDIGKRDQVKRITVKPGGQALGAEAPPSLRTLGGRSRHGQVQKGDETSFSRRRVTYIPLGEVHALENPADSAGTDRGPDR